MYKINSSKLYPLKPLGVGTSHVESLTSYISRLAEAHSVKVSSLVVKEIAPEFSHLVHFRRYSRFLNTQSELSEQFVIALEKSTQVNGMAALTMLPWKEVISSNQLFRDHKAWCPECLMQMKREGLVVEPLIWFIKFVNCCPIHKRKLISLCPVCGQASPKIATTSRVGYCPKCNSFLGIDCEYLDNPTMEELKISNMIGELLSLNGRIGEVKVDYFLYNLNLMLINCRRKPNILAKKIKINRSTIDDWLSNSLTPTLGLLLHICLMSNISLIDLLTKTLEKIDFVTSTNYLREQLYSKRYNDYDQVGAYLDGLLHSENIVPIAQISKHLGMCPRTLKKHFPLLYEELIQRYKTHLNDMKNQRKEVIANNIIQSFKTLRSKGVYPGKRTIAKEIGISYVIFRDKYFRDVWHELFNYKDDIYDTGVKTKNLMKMYK